MVVGSRPIERGCGYYDGLWMWLQVGKLERRMPRRLHLDRTIHLQVFRTCPQDGEGQVNKDSIPIF